MTQNNSNSSLKNSENVVGTIFGIQHFSIHDGPGIRTTVFLKGCPLSCLWCHNPEGISQQPVLAFTRGKCVDCGICLEVCPDVHKIIKSEHFMDRSNCIVCGRCVNACCGKALEIIGRRITATEVIQIVLRDKRYYEVSNGGVTFSGGEPMMQFDFLYSLLKNAKVQGIHTAIETSGFSSSSFYEKILPLVDLFLFDFKESNSKKHEEYTGVDNDRILNNLKMLHDAGAGIILRCPIIPGINDRDDHFSAIAEITNKLKNLKGAEILAYHQLGVSKTNRIGFESQSVYERPDDKSIDIWKDIIRQFGGKLIED